MSETEIQILSVIDSYDGIAQSGRNKGQPYICKILSIMHKGEPTEVSAFVVPDKDYYFKVGEFYEGNVVKYKGKLTFKPTNKIIKSDEPLKEELKQFSDEPTHTPTESKAKPVLKTKVGDTTIYTQEGTKEAIYTHEQTKEKSMQKMNILNNAVAKLCATIKISQPVGGDGSKQIIAFGDAHYNIDDLLKKYILEFQKYYKED